MSRHNYTASCAKDFINFFQTALRSFVQILRLLERSLDAAAPEENMRDACSTLVSTSSQAPWYSDTGGTPMLLSAPV